MHQFHVTTCYVCTVLIAFTTCTCFAIPAPYCTCTVLLCYVPYRVHRFVTSCCCCNCYRYLLVHTVAFDTIVTCYLFIMRVQLFHLIVTPPVTVPLLPYFITLLLPYHFIVALLLLHYCCCCNCCCCRTVHCSTCTCNCCYVTCALHFIVAVTPLLCIVLHYCFHLLPCARYRYCYLVAAVTINTYLFI